MTRIYTTIHIRKPIEQVFDYVTTPANWPRWHPSSLAVSGSTDHSLAVGEQVREEFRVAGRHGYVVWTVREREAPRRWSIEGQVESGGGGTVSYTLSSDEAGTQFEREFVYALHHPLLRLLNWLVLRRRVQAESAEALRRLKQVLETR
jgi:uncharacterized protein YndB with AHSA1/START domain